jgi:PAS domain S-box-containing protein
MFWSYLEQRHHIATDVQSNLLRMARLVVSHQRDLIVSTQQLLTTLSEIPEVRMGNQEACNELFNNLLKRFSHYVNISAVNPKGIVYASGLAGYKADSLADQDCLQLALQNGEFRVGEFAVCPVTGKPVLTVAFPVIGENGCVQTVILAALSLKWLDDIASNIIGASLEQLPQGSVFTVRDREGTILARYPGGTQWVGRSVSDAPVLKAALERKGEGLVEAFGIDGVKRLYAFAPLINGNDAVAYASLGVSVEAAYKEADSLLLRNLVGLGVVLLIGLFVGWRSNESLVMLPLGRLLDAVRRMSDGDLTTRAQLESESNTSNEFDQLAGAFNQMVSSLEQRTSLLTEAEEKYRMLVERLPAVLYCAGMDRGSKTLYVSPQMEGLLGFSPAEWVGDSGLWERQLHPEDRGKVLAQLEQTQATGEAFSIEYRMLHRDGEVVWVRDESVVVRNGKGRPSGLQGIIRNISERKLMELNLLKLTRALKTLSDCNQALIRAADEVSLLEQTCRILVHIGGYRMAWVGFAADGLELRVVPVAQAGFDENYLDGVWSQVDPTISASHPTGAAIRTATVSVIQNVMTDPGFISWRPEADRLGYRSCVAFPFLVNGKAIGALTIYGNDPDPFTLDEIHLLTELSDDVSFGIETIRARQIHREAEESLRETTQTLQALVKASPLAILATDPDVNVIMWNEAAERMFGWREEEVMGQFLPTVPEHELPRLHNLVGGALHGESLTGVQVVRQRKDGSLLDISLSNAPLYGADGAIKGVMAILEDITSRKDLEKERALLATAVEQAAEGLAITDKGGNLQYVNPAFEGLTGLARTETRNFYGWLTDVAERDTISREELLGSIRSGKVWFGRLNLGAGSGASRNIALTVAPVRDELQKIVRHVAVLRDVTEVVRLEGQLHQAQKMEAIGTLAGGIAHDFNNILMGMIGYTEMVLSQTPDDSKTWRMLQSVLDGGKRAADLVRQILAFSHQGKETRKPVKISTTVKETLRLLRASLPSTIEIRRDFSGASSDLVLADPTQLHQVLLNLCTNSSHAMRGKTGVLEIGLRNIQFRADTELPHPKLKPGPYVLLSVSDTGHGIDHSILDRIFDPFFTTKNRGEGTGLGLAVVRATMENHGGAITVESEVGRGSTFHLFFPRHEAHLISEPTIISSPLQGGIEHILVLDDEPTNAKMLGQTLELLGYHVTVKTSSIDALELLRKDPKTFDLLITDQTMPNLTGVDLTKLLLRIRPDLPVILCTGFSEDVSEETARSIGIRRFILKPVLRWQIAEAVREVLDECRSEGK